MPKTEMLINYVPGEECRIAIVRDGRLEEFYQERASTESHVGNIYKGKVLNVEPSIQAAFVDFGLDRNGFLHISDLHPMYFPGKDREEFEQVGSKTPHRERPPIQKCLRRGQEVLVQVLKEGIGTKGPTLTSYLSIPGRFIVMMPYMQRLGVSRKVEDDDARRESRQLLAELNPPEGFGFIVRTAGIGQTKTDLKRDLAYLQRLWKNIEQRRKKIGRVGELYTESDLIIRTVRDVFSNEIDRIVVDEPTAARRAYDFLAVASPRSRSKVVYYNDPVPLFHRFDIERQIESIHDRHVPLPSGGSLVIDSAEALVAIDVNSGKSRDARDAETNAFNTNKEAADEITRQLRLRDLGGVIVNDFIDMRDLKHRRAIETRFRANLKKDRARTRVGSISQFGLLEMTRQRMRPSLQTSITSPCTHCDGFGHVRSPESVVLDVMRRLALTMQHEKITRIELTISPDVAFHLLNRKRNELVALESRHGKSVMVRVGGGTVDYVHISAFDARGPVDLDALTGHGKLPREVPDAYVDLSAGELPLEDEYDDYDDLDETETPSDEPAGEAAEAHDGEPQPAPRSSTQRPPATQSRDQARDASRPQESQASSDADETADRPKRRRRRRGGRRRSGGGGESRGVEGADQARDTQSRQPQEAMDKADQHAEPQEALAHHSDGEGHSQPPASTPGPQDRRAPAPRPEAADASDQGDAADGNGNGNGNGDEGENGDGQATGRRRRRRRGGRGRRRSGQGDAQASADPAHAPGGDANGNVQSDTVRNGNDNDGNTMGNSQPPAANELALPKPAPVAAEPAPVAAEPAPAKSAAASSKPKPLVGRGYSNRIVGEAIEGDKASS